MTGTYSLIQAYNFINLPRKYDFSKFFFKFGKKHILQKYIQTDFEYDLVILSQCGYYYSYNQVADTNKRRLEAYLETNWASMIELFYKKSHCNSTRVCVCVYTLPPWRLLPSAKCLRHTWGYGSTMLCCEYYT